MSTEPATATLSEPETSNEAIALLDIVLWSQDLPMWQQDALRRLCSSGILNEQDLQELVDLCKGSAGAIPLGPGHVHDPKASTAAVYVSNIHGVQNVNALAEGECLTFDKKGLTVVYGDNGTGKSGYARILKKVCRARSPKDDNIHPNIYATRTGPQKAVVEFNANGQNRQELWTMNQPSDPLLSSVSVFDSSTANVHVDQTNDVAYTPFPMKILEELAHSCQDIKKTISAEIKALEQQTPATIKNQKCHSQTGVGKLIKDLHGGTKVEQVRSLATLTKTQTTRLETLRGDLSRDPAKTAHQLQLLKKRLDEHIGVLAALKVETSEEKTSALTELYRRYQSAKEAAAVAANQLFASEPLPNVGSDAWRALWEAARAYSQQQAYPDETFPFTGDQSRCVLCQQELDQEATQRMTRFEQFIRDDSKRREEEARRSYERSLNALHAGNISFAQLRTMLSMMRDELNDDNLADHVRSFAVIAKWRLRHISRDHKGSDILQPPPTGLFPSDALSHCSADLAKRVAALLQEEKSEERKEIIDEFVELSDRQWLSVVEDDVVAEIDRHKKIAALNLALKDTTTNRITAKSADIAEHLVTNALRARFAVEVDRLGVAGLAIELRKEKSSYGVPLFRVSLIKKPDARVGDILSEGEHRCVALAAFLAELSTTESQSAIVFDDPVSSLDHMHRETLAARLAAEGQHRQVIVFTHDIAFLFLLYEACREQGGHIAFRSVTKGTDFAGFCNPNPPPNAQPVDKVIESLQKQLDNQKIQHGQGDQEAWYLTVRSLQEQLRTTWERAVEEAVAPVIKRLANKVDTKGLSKLTVLTVDDCKLMREAYGRCSNLLHSSSETLNKPLPAPDKIQDDQRPS